MIKGRCVLWLFILITIMTNTSFSMQVGENEAGYVSDPYVDEWLCAQEGNKGEYTRIESEVYEDCSDNSDQGTVSHVVRQKLDISGLSDAPSSVSIVHESGNSVYAPVNRHQPWIVPLADPIEPSLEDEMLTQFRMDSYLRHINELCFSQIFRQNKAYLFPIVNLDKVKRAIQLIQQYYALLRGDKTYSSVQNLILEPGSNVLVLKNLCGEVQGLIRLLNELRCKGFIDEHLRILQSNFSIVLPSFDPGAYGVDLLFLVLMLKMRNPNRVFISFGKRDKSILFLQGFLIELSNRYLRWNTAKKTWFGPEGFGEELHAISHLYEQLPESIVLRIVNQRDDSGVNTQTKPTSASYKLNGASWDFLQESPIHL